MSDSCWCGGRVAYDLDQKINVCLDSDYHDPEATGTPDRYDVLYIAGPMSNIPDNNYPAFHAASEALRGAGYSVVNPAEFGVAEGVRVHYVDLLREDLRQMLETKAIAVLDGWIESTGAFNEVTVARTLKMPVRTVAEWLERAAKELQ